MSKPADLHKIWAAPDNTRLTSKQYSFRLPVHVAAKISAICELFPEKSRTQIVGDLLATALSDFEDSFEYVEGDIVGYMPDTHDPVHEDCGLRPKFRMLADQYYKELEREMGNENPKSLFERPASPNPEKE